ncbi:G protein-coupled receptor 157 [Pelomyxa schiedti]|nr:G protein-coupled receptor 157 [Pelomyxa schiedti]
MHCATQAETYGVSITFGALSALACIVVFVTYFMFPETRTKARFLVLMLSICDFGQAIFFCIAGDFEGTGCRILGALGLFFANCTFIWTACISVFVFVSIRTTEKRLNDNSVAKINRSKFIVLSEVLGWGVPAILSLTVLFAGKTETDPEGFWCFINSEFFLWRLFSLIVPLLVCWAITVVMYSLANIYVVRVKRLLKLQQVKHGAELKKVHNQKTWAWQLRLLLIPIVFFILRIWDVIYRLWEIICEITGDDVPTFFCTPVYVALVIIGDASQGLVNCIIFVLLEPEVRVKWLHFFRSIKSSGASTSSHRQSTIIELQAPLIPDLHESDGVMMQQDA